MSLPFCSDSPEPSQQLLEWALTELYSPHRVHPATLYAGYGHATPTTVWIEAIFHRPPLWLRQTLSVDVPTATASLSLRRLRRCPGLSQPTGNGQRCHYRLMQSEDGCLHLERPVEDAVGCSFWKRLMATLHQPPSRGAP
ncbi:hypothetical protein GCM10008957_32580 [Deinococcus ruber]|uniref:Uncharacterized protein n=1 Tax=Deinococcus ruber TaxID=1848197 RepID=A0A918F7V3_9DEIO|nr:hypothetical protein GCM10008957_32580 [Deinococcus ruber]